MNRSISSVSRSPAPRKTAPSFPSTSILITSGTRRPSSAQSVRSVAVLTLSLPSPKRNVMDDPSPPNDSLPSRSVTATGKTLTLLTAFHAMCLLRNQRLAADGSKAVTDPDGPTRRASAMATYPLWAPTSQT